MQNEGSTTQQNCFLFGSNRLNVFTDNFKSVQGANLVFLLLNSQILYVLQLPGPKISPRIGLHFSWKIWKIFQNSYSEESLWTGSSEDKEEF